MDKKQQLPINEEINKAKDLARSSGNNFHSSVVKLLREKEWVVQISPYYMDNITDKPREIDIVAEKAFWVKDTFGQRAIGSVNVRLFIECKYINSTSVFWFDKKDRDRAIGKIMKETGLAHPNTNVSIEKHHYLLDTEVAKLFDSDRNGSSERDTINKAINQSLNATVFFRNAPSIIPAEHRPEVLCRLCYPIIICNNFKSFFKIPNGDIDNLVSLADNFQCEVNYVYSDGGNGNISEYSLIDFVSLPTLDAFLAMIEGVDVKTMIEHFYFNDLMKSRAESKQYDPLG